MYTSPYCKELLNTDIPLKTIINRSKKVNTKNLAKYKQTLATSRSKSKSQSRSKSGSKSMRGVVVTGFESHHNQTKSPAKSLSKSKSKSVTSPSGKSRSKSKSVSKALGVGKSRRKQLKEKTEADLRNKLMNEIKNEHNRSKSQKRQKGLESLVPQNQKAQLKGFEPKDPASPTKHRKNYCCSPNKDQLPLKKSANSKWSNNQQSAKKDQQRNASRSGSKPRDRSARSQSRKIKTIFYKDGDSHIDMQNSKFSP